MLQVRSYSFCGPHNLFAIHKNINLSALNDSNWMWPCTTQVYAFLALTAFDAPGSPEKILEIDFNPFCLIEYIHRNRLVVGPALLLDYYREKKGLPVSEGFFPSSSAILCLFQRLPFPPWCCAWWSRRVFLSFQMWFRSFTWLIISINMVFVFPNAISFIQSIDFAFQFTFVKPITWFIFK